MITCPPSVHQHLLNDFSEIPESTFLKFIVEPSVKGGLKICTNGNGPLITMAAMPVYSKMQLCNL